MPTLLFARPPLDAKEERQVRKLSGARHAPSDWTRRARMIALSWQGQRTTAIAAALGCHPQTVRERLARFNAQGLDGLGDRPGAGRKRRLTERERGVVIALARSDPLGRTTRRGDGELDPGSPDKEAHWSLDALTAAARAGRRHRPQPGAPHLEAGGRALAPHAYVGHERGRRLRPKRARVVALYTAPPPGATTLCLDELGPVTPRAFPPRAGLVARRPPHHGAPHL